MTPFVVAGGIVRNRAWVLPRHLAKVSFAHRTDGALFYVTGDNTDGTEEELRSWKFPGPSERAFLLGGHVLDYLVHDTGEPSWTRDGKEGPRYKSSHMAAERNLWASEALKRWPQATHLWVVDSDVLPDPDVLEKLLALQAPVAAAFVPIGDGETPIHMDNFTYRQIIKTGLWTFNGKRTGEEKDYLEPHRIWLCGGCYLLERSALDAGLRWGEHPQGEDGWIASECWRMSLKMMVDPSAKCIHVMERDR